MRRGILASRDELAGLRDRINRKPFDGMYDALRRRCALILESSPVTEAQWRSLWEHGQWSAAVVAARTAQGRIMDLLIAHHIDRNIAYRDRAVEELKDIIGWSTWVDPCHEHLPADLCTAEAAVAAVVGLDWLWEDLPEPDRLRVMQALRHKAIEPYRQAVSHGAWWYTCYHSWNAVVNSGCGLAGLALGEEEPAAEETYNLAAAGLRNFFDALGREGGWDEGTGYWGYALRHVLLLAEASARLLDDRRMLHTRGMGATGLFPVYFTPNGQPASFGDNPAVPLYGTFYLLTKHYGQTEVTRWLDTYAFHRDAATTGWASEGLGLIFRPVDADVPDDSELAPVKVYHEIGWAAIADRWPRPSMYVAVKTGDLSANHSQHDMNSIQLQVDGEMLLIDLGHGPFSQEYFSDARGEFYQVQAAAHNTITVGQRDHQIDAQGQIVEAASDNACRWVACDAEAACGDNVSFMRHVVMLVNPAAKEGHTVIVLDELSDREDEDAELVWHTAGQLHLNARAMTGSITGLKSRLHFALACTADAVASSETRRVDPQDAHNILRLSFTATSSVHLVSVFSRQPVGKPPEIKCSGSGEVRLKVGSATLRFKPHRHRLQLAEVRAH